MLKIEIKFFGLEFRITDKEAETYAINRRRYAAVYRDVESCVQDSIDVYRQAGASESQIQERVSALRETARKGPSHPDNINWNWYITPCQQWAYAFGVFLTRPFNFGGVDFEDDGHPRKHYIFRRSFLQYLRSLF